MKRLSRATALTTYMLALLGMLLFGGSKYDWMAVMAPSIPVDAIETDGSRTLVRTFLFVTAILASALVALSSETRAARLAPLSLASLAVVVYLTSRI